MGISQKAVHVAQLLSIPVNNFSIMLGISCLPGLNQYHKQRFKDITFIYIFYLFMYYFERVSQLAHISYSTLRPSINIKGNTKFIFNEECEYKN